MKAYLTTLFVLILILNVVFLCFIPETEEFKNGQMEMNLLVGFNSLVALIAYIVKDKLKETSHLIFLTTIPMRFVSFLLFFVITKAVGRIDLNQWVQIYLVVFIVFHITDTGFYLYSIRQNEQNI